MGASTAKQEAQALVEQSIEQVTTREKEFTEQLFGELFRRHPELEPLFSAHSWATRHQMVRETLRLATAIRDEPSWVKTLLLELGQRHTGYEVTPEMFGWFEACLLDTLAKFAGDWSPDCEKAWREALSRISRGMTEGFPR